MGTQLTSKATCNKSFCQDYLLLTPEDVTFWDLIMLLFSKNISHRKSIDCPDGTVESSFSHRFIIFISIIAQKVLHLVDQPLGWLGSTIEFVANFFNANGGFLKLPMNLLLGKLVILNRESPEFLSVVGLDDIRRDLDTTIKHEDPRYRSALAVMAAKAVYENQASIKQTVEQHWKMEFMEFFNCWNDYEEDYTTEVFMWSEKSGDSEVIGVSFRGTLPFNAKDWSINFDLSWYHLPGIGKVHAGFLKALGLQKSTGWPKDIQEDQDKPYAYYIIRQKLKERLEMNPNAKFMLTGHSLGAALVIVFPAILAFHEETDLLSKLEGVYVGASFVTTAFG